MSIESLQRRVDRLDKPDQDRKIKFTSIVLMPLKNDDDEPHDPADPCVLFEVGTGDMTGRAFCFLDENYFPSFSLLNEAHHEH